MNLIPTKATLSIIILLLVTACTKTESVPTSTNAESSFQLIILKENWSDLSLGYDPDISQSKLANANTSESLFIVGVNQIEQYDWNSQTITLTEKATEDLVNKLKAQKDAKGSELRNIKDLKEINGYDTPVEPALYMRAFIVKVNGQSKYGGIFLNASSSFHVNFPVIRVTMTGGKATFNIFPITTSFNKFDVMKFTNNNFLKLIQDDDIKTIFDNAGILIK